MKKIHLFTAILLTACGNLLAEHQQVVNMSEESKIQIKAFKGSEVLPYIPQVAQLRITIFREFPYLYEGSLAYEEEYLQMYARSANSNFIIAEAHGKVIGAVTGVPAAESMEEIKALFLDQKLPTEGVYYL